LASRPRNEDAQAQWKTKKRRGINRGAFVS
jgi:hypothetical protein